MGQVVIHRVFRREFGLSSDLVAAVRPGDLPRAALLAEHIGDVADALHHHHHSEDELLWPRLLARASVHAGLDEHLAEEERAILPIAAEHLSTAEWNELGERGSASIPKNKLLIFLGMILEDADPAERTAFLAKMPLIARIMWRLLGRRQYDAYVTELRAA